MANAPFVHVVLFSLPEGTPPEELIADIDARLSRLPGVLVLRRGVPADTWTPERSAVDRDYDVGLLTLFQSKDDLDAYLAHPEHAAFAAAWDSVCGVRVFDFE
jgi:hypothetical protein